MGSEGQCVLAPGQWPWWRDGCCWTWPVPMDEIAASIGSHWDHVCQGLRTSILLPFSLEPSERERSIMQKSISACMSCCQASDALPKDWVWLKWVGFNSVIHWVSTSQVSRPFLIQFQHSKCHVQRHRCGYFPERIRGCQRPLLTRQPFQVDVNLAGSTREMLLENITGCLRVVT